MIIEVLKLRLPYNTSGWNSVYVVGQNNRENWANFSHK